MGLGWEGLDGWMDVMGEAGKGGGGGGGGIVMM